MRSRRVVAGSAVALAMLVAAGCAAGSPTRPARTGTHPSVSTSSTASDRRSAAGRTSLPRFSATVSGPLSARNVRYSWHRGCPVPPRRLRAIRMRYIGFDGSARWGTIIVNARVVRQVIKVFSTLYRATFPIRRMEPVDVFHGSDPRSMAADNTSGFNCRRAVAPGPPQWSMHAYGLAIDVNTVQNPYVEAGVGVQPPAGAAYLNRSDIRPGMAYKRGVLVSAFTSVGWGWGGLWSGSPDYQHFSVNGH